MWIANGWKEYEVIDTSCGEKLERWGKYLLVRPDPQVIWDTPKIPLMGQIKELPFTASLGAAVIVCVHLAPSWLCLRCIPDYLRIRTDKEIFSPSLQFLSAGSINYFVFFPAICYPHFIFTSFSIISHKSPECHP